MNQQKNTSPNTLRPPWVYLARVGWILLATACLTLFTLSTVETIRTPLPSCATQDPCTAVMTREDVQVATEEMGLPFPFLPLYLAFSVVARLSLAIVGLIIFWRRSNDGMAMVFSGALMTVLLEGSQSFSPTLNFVQSILFGIGTALFLPIPFIFPSGQTQPRWMRWPVIALTIVYTAITIFTYEKSEYVSLSAGVTVLWAGMAAYAMPFRYFRVSNAVERQQTKWVLLGISATFIVGIYYSFMSSIYPSTAPSIARIIALLINMPLYLGCYGFFAFSILVAMLRYRLWDIDILIRRTLQYTLLTGLLALTYFGSVILLQAGFRTLTGQTNSPIVTVLSTLGIAALFTPLRNRVQDFIDRRFYRKKYNAERALAQFAAIARDEVDMDKLTAALIGVVEETVQPEKVSVWIVSERIPS